MYKKRGKFGYYRYCSHCPAGPFTDQDVAAGKLIAVGQRQPIYFCLTCYKMLFSEAEKETYRIPKDKDVSSEVDDG